MEDVVGTLLVRGERNHILSDFMLIGQKDDESKADVQIVDDRLVRYHVALRRFPEQSMWIIKDLCPERNALLIAGRNVGGQPIIFRSRISFSVADVDFVFEPAKHTVQAPRRQKAAVAAADDQLSQSEPAAKRKTGATKKKTGKTWKTVTLSPTSDAEDDDIIEVLPNSDAKRARC